MWIEIICTCNIVNKAHYNHEHPPSSTIKFDLMNNQKGCYLIHQRGRLLYPGNYWWIFPENPNSIWTTIFWKFTCVQWKKFVMKYSTTRIRLNYYCLDVRFAQIWKTTTCIYLYPPQIFMWTNSPVFQKIRIVLFSNPFVNSIRNNCFFDVVIF